MLGETTLQISTNCGACPQHPRALCAALPEEHLTKLKAGARRRFIPQGQPVFRQGDEVTAFALIVRGTIKLTKTTASGDEHIVALAFASGFLGNIHEKHNRYSAIAATDADLCVYARPGFLRLFEQSSELSRRVFEGTERELQLARDWLTTLAKASAYERVAGFFLFLTTRAGEGGPEQPQRLPKEFELPLSRAELASYLGLTLETVSRSVTRLKQRGLIAFGSGRQMMVPDLERLAAEANQDG